MRLGVALACLANTPATLFAQTQPLGANLERFAYPAPVSWYEAQSQGGPVRMAYLDVKPASAANGTTVVLFHGKNFCAATWFETARSLAADGYRVIAPDQIGFCKSSKPRGYQYSFHAMAELTRALLDRAGVGRVVLVGHSTGGILAARFALMHPERVSQLVLVNPLGLNDTLAEGVPYADGGTLRQEEAKTDAASIRAYQLRNYYHGEWRPDYDRWVAMLAGQYAGPDGDIVRDAQARLSDMIQTQPVAAELPRLRVPVTLIIGQRDTTAFRGNTAPPGARVRTVPQAAEEAVRRIPNARLIRLADLGHAPQVEAPATFMRSLRGVLAASQKKPASPSSGSYRMIRRRLVVTGRVQNVFYRNWFVEQALARGLDGWVRNRADGSVEAVIEGAPEMIQAMIAHAAQGSPASRVEHVAVSDDAPPETLSGFAKRPTR